jgi:hypothetical protein
MIVKIFLALLVYVVLPPAAISAGATLLLCWLRPRLSILMVVLTASLLASAVGISRISFFGVFEAHCNVVSYFINCGHLDIPFTICLLLLSMLIAFLVAWPISGVIGDRWDNR